LKKVRVLVVEDSAFMRRIIGDIIREHPDLELMPTARDGLDAIEKIKANRPDVVTMDLEMPRLDGLETVRRIMSEDPIPVIMLSSHASTGSEFTLKALEAGAVDFISKPGPASLEESIEELKNLLTRKILAAASARLNLITAVKKTSIKTAEKASAYRGRSEISDVIVAIGASTGGPKALEAVFSVLHADLPAAVLLSQHMPPGFTFSFAQRLDLMTHLRVKEAENGDILLKGQALVAPGGFHMVCRNGSIVLDAGPKVNFVRPSIDVMLNSLIECSQRVLVVIMTGMGRDGAAGAAALKQKKKDTILIAQDPDTALIPSMPEALIKSSLCDAQVPLGRLAAEIERYIVSFQ
jgi:two-component system, chemotaxis family, protein-glutamate methylesterase/glutaminase